MKRKPEDDPNDIIYWLPCKGRTFIGCIWEARIGYTKCKELTRMFGPPCAGCYDNAQKTLNVRMESIKAMNEKRETYTIETDRTFQYFFENYKSKHKRKNGAKRCYAVWKKLTLDDIDKIMIHFPHFCAENPKENYKYIPKPLNYLKERYWEDQEQVITTSGGIRSTFTV